jgi:hypothetical protein
MRSTIANFLLGAMLCLCTPVLAHHTGSHSVAGSGPRVSVYQGSQTKPASRAFFTLDASQLDDSVGQVYTSTLGGEYSINKRFSVLGLIPLTHIAHNFRPSQTGIGDVSVQGKFLLWENEKTISYVSSLWSLPTGDEDQGLGRGAVGQQVDGLIGLHLKKWTVFGYGGINFGYESESEPILLASVGVATPAVIHERVYGAFNLSSQIFLDADVFASGSSKVFAEPQINVILDPHEHWLMTLAGRVSMIDELTRKPGVSIASTDNALLNDILFGGSFSLNYQF